ncbi:DNA-binding transcriptional regulator [Hoylesella timonensis]|uniref:Transcriptional regulator n=1 Tax=Hoylesella timonensis S9-PR14 TaxID=1401062 RepID=A0A098YSA4_9BACT|nr:DNA-binding transcriptional regulator [Hoylesella timonensis]KGI22249.1 transcriptional regulator [Hoylesella timonensis S9-PR14]
MVRLIFLSDFTEAYAHHLLQGILTYAKQKDQEAWVVCRMPPSYKETYGIKGVVEWAKKWDANAIIGRFNHDDDIDLFRRNGIIAIAQDFKRRFNNIPNITSNYHDTGRLAAQFFIEKGYKHFAFYGYKDTVWSDERCEGFYEGIREAGYGKNFYTYTNQQLETLWYYDTTPLLNWLNQLPQQTAVFCCDDNQGNKITEICKSNSIKIPEHLAVLGVDNDTTLCELSDPPLSSIHLDIEAGGYETAELIMNLMKQKDFQPQDVIIKAISIINRASTNSFATNDMYINEALEFIHSNLDKALNVTDLVKKLPLSRRLLEMRFKKVTGRSVYNYIIYNRIEEFARKIHETDKPINEIATEMEFYNYSNLVQQFKQIKGCTPTEFRKRNKAYDL